MMYAPPEVRAQIDALKRQIKNTPLLVYKLRALWPSATWEEIGGEIGVHKNTACRNHKIYVDRFLKPIK